jgi:hypothetical protein
MLSPYAHYFAIIAMPSIVHWLSFSPPADAHSPLSSSGFSLISLRGLLISPRFLFLQLSSLRRDVFRRHHSFRHAISLRRHAFAIHYTFISLFHFDFAITFHWSSFSPLLMPLMPASPAQYFNTSFRFSLISHSPGQPLHISLASITFAR